VVGPAGQAEGEIDGHGYGAREIRGEQSGRAQRSTPRQIGLLRRDRRQELLPAIALVADLPEIEYSDPRLLVECRGEVALEGLRRPVGVLDREANRREVLEQLGVGGLEMVLREKREDRARGAHVQSDRDLAGLGRGQIVGGQRVASRGGGRQGRGRAAAGGQEEREGPRAGVHPRIASIALRVSEKSIRSASGFSAASRSGLVMPVATATERTPRARPHATS